MNWISIDPGSTATGLCLWQNNIPKKVWTFRFTTRKQYISVFDILLKKNHYHIEKGVCEDVSRFKSEKGEVTLNSGALVKLARFTGYIEALFHVNKIPFKYVKPIVWKGQLPKEVVKERVKRLWPECPARNEHEFDAVGIGFNELGLL